MKGGGTVLIKASNVDILVSVDATFGMQVL